MKHIRASVVLILLSCFLTLLNLSTALAHDGEEHGGEGNAIGTHDHSSHSHAGHDHTGKDNSDSTLNDILGKIHTAYNAISQSINSKSLSELHGSSEEVGNLAKLLTTKIEGPDKDRTIGLINNLIRASEALHESGDKSDQAGAEANLKKLTGLLKILDERLNYKPDDAAMNHAAAGHMHGGEHPHGEKCSGPDVTVNIMAKQYAFEPSLIKVKQGQKVCLKLSSKDVEHGIMIEDYMVHVHGTTATTGEIQFVANNPGEFNFLCHQVCGSGHADMKGKLIVE